MAIKHTSQLTANTSLKEIRARDPLYYEHTSEDNLMAFGEYVPKELLMLEPLPAADKTFIDAEQAALLEDLKKPTKYAHMNVLPKLLGAVHIDEVDKQLAEEAAFWLEAFNIQRFKDNPDKINPRGVDVWYDGALGEIATARLFSDEPVTLKNLVFASKIPPVGADFQDIGGTVLDTKGFSFIPGNRHDNVRISLNNKKHNELLQQGTNGYVAAVIDHERDLVLLYLVDARSIIGKTKEGLFDELQPTLEGKSNVSGGWDRAGTAKRKKDEWYYYRGMLKTNLEKHFKAANDLVGIMTPRMGPKQIEKLANEKSGDLSFSPAYIDSLSMKRQQMKIREEMKAKASGPQLSAKEIKKLDQDLGW